MTDAAIETSNLVLEFGGLVALDHVSMQVERGSLTAIVGPNGAGKTSLLNCINGLYHASEGSVIVNGEDVTRRSPADIARLGVARTFQHVELVAELSVLDNLLLVKQIFEPPRLRSAALFWGRYLRRETQAREDVEAAIEFFELEPYRHRLVSDLPFGVQKIVGICRAFVQQADIVLLDEPSAGLNREEKEDVARFLLRARHEFQPTLLWVEHDMQLVRDLADHIVVVHYGKVLIDGPPETVLSDQNVIEVYLGSRWAAGSSTTGDSAEAAPGDAGQGESG